jgi:NADPH oxidase
MLQSGELTDEPARELFLKEKIDRWYVQRACHTYYLLNSIQDGERGLPETASKRRVRALPFFADSSRFVFVFLILHLMVFIFGMMTYGMTVDLPPFTSPNSTHSDHRNDPLELA